MVQHLGTVVLKGLMQPTFCFSPNILAKANKMPIMTMIRATLDMCHGQDLWGTSPLPDSCLMIQSVATGKQWSGPMKSHLLWFHWSAPLVSGGGWLDRQTESKSGSGPFLCLFFSFFFSSMMIFFFFLPFHPHITSVVRLGAEHQVANCLIKV